MPVMVDSGISIFAESRSSCDKPELIMVDDFSEMNCVFAHGCRGWWYHGAAFFAPAKHNVWLSFSVLAPQKLPGTIRDSSRPSWPANG